MPEKCNLSSFTSQFQYGFPNPVFFCKRFTSSMSMQWSPLCFCKSCFLSLDPRSILEALPVFFDSQYPVFPLTHYQTAIPSLLLLPMPQKGVCGNLMWTEVREATPRNSLYNNQSTGRIRGAGRGLQMGVKGWDVLRFLACLVKLNQSSQMSCG